MNSNLRSAPKAQKKGRNGRRRSRQRKPQAPRKLLKASRDWRLRKPGGLGKQTRPQRPEARNSHPARAWSICLDTSGGVASGADEQREVWTFARQPVVEGRRAKQEPDFSRHEGPRADRS